MSIIITFKIIVNICLVSLVTAQIMYCLSHLKNKMHNFQSAHSRVSYLRLYTIFFSVFLDTAYTERYMGIAGGNENYRGYDVSFLPL